MAGYRWNGTLPDGPLCACGCSEPVKIAARSDARFGTVKGRPMRYVHGHNPPRPTGPRGYRAWHGGGLRGDLRSFLWGAGTPPNWAREAM